MEINERKEKNSDKRKVIYRILNMYLFSKSILCVTRNCKFEDKIGRAHV